MLNYSQSNVFILQNDFYSLQEQFPEVWAVIQTCGRNKDHRTFESYAQDLVASWLYEDTLLFYMQKYGLRVNLNGADQGREIFKQTMFQLNILNFMHHMVNQHIE